MIAYLYGHLLVALRKHADLAATLHLLEWDQETFMPSGTLAERARQIGTLSAVLHEYETAPAFLALVDGLYERRADLDPRQAVDVRETKWRMDRRRALPGPLVAERARVQAEARGVWAEARRDNDFSRLAPRLQRIVELERQFAAAVDPNRPAYDVLLEEYEPGICPARLRSLLATLREGLRPLVARLDRNGAAAKAALCGRFPLDRQRRFNRLVAETIGFDFTRGRLDEAAHPFTIDIGGDVRLTTRYDENDLRYALYSTLHEAGHGLYEQGLDPDALGTPRGTACSLGVHESQSRFWENHVGRMEAFWERFLAPARELFPELADVPLRSVLASANEAKPSLIRTEADEITYNLHIILRFELETALIEDRLRVDDLPAAWRAKMEEYFGLEPPSDREGVLQDVHWASGTIGYFPTYTLGNVYAAQLMDAAEASLGSIADLVRAGDFPPLLQWLRQRVHRLGQTYPAGELITQATGEAPTAQPLLDHLSRKLEMIESL